MPLKGSNHLTVSLCPGQRIICLRLMRLGCHQSLGGRHMAP